MADWGVFAVARDIWDHPVLFGDEPMSKREAWMWLVSAAAWKPMKIGRGARVVHIERGEFCFSIRFLEKKWHWKPGRVERFLDVLKKHDMIRDTSRDGVKIYSISNYNTYQVVGLPERDNNRDDMRDTSATASRHERDKEETIKHSNIQNDDDKRARVQNTLNRVCEILNIRLQDDPDRITWPRQIEAMLRDGLSETEIIRAAEITRAKGKVNLSYLRAVAVNPPKPAQISTPPPKPAGDEIGERLKAKWAKENEQAGRLRGGAEADEGGVFRAIARGSG